MSYHPKPSSSPLSYPSFHPHITLASIPSGPGVLEVLRASLPTGQCSIPVNFASLETGDHYFRSVYIAVKPSREPNTPRFPHVSVYYIADTEAQRREETVEALKEEGIAVNTHESVTIDCSKTLENCKGHGSCVSGFRSAEVWIVLCDGPVETWTVLEKLRLQ
ncbi:hypothetical protein K488DRAFT_89659 [Vararia minispora EC-137]|uniref:Uncharacterized protein n=1 Tax=Vararia minispora EC-137 TaxID=1314806 RepID=A0ACB8Q9N1_9AGAM|nr:hypothetical protein K488DRAFT_89659 [Vararia minispora EC-137]